MDLAIFPTTLTPDCKWSPLTIINRKIIDLCSQVHPFPQIFGKEAGAPPGGPCTSRLLSLSSWFCKSENDFYDQQPGRCLGSSRRTWFFWNRSRVQAWRLQPPVFVIVIVIVIAGDHLILPVVVEGRVALDLVWSCQDSPASSVASLFHHDHDDDHSDVDDNVTWLSWLSTKTTACIPSTIPQPWTNKISRAYQSLGAAVWNDKVAKVGCHNSCIIHHGCLKVGYNHVFETVWKIQS